MISIEVVSLGNSLLSISTSSCVDNNSYLIVNNGRSGNIFLSFILQVVYGIILVSDEPISKLLSLTFNLTLPTSDSTPTVDLCITYTFKYDLEL